MASLPLSAPPPNAAGPQSGGPGGPPPSGGQGPQPGGPALAIFARLVQDAQQMASQFSVTSPMAEEIQNQVRQALLKVLGSQGPASQQAPPI